MNIAVVILAAGKSSRMGSIKQLLPYKNSSLLQFAINQAFNSKANKVYCVLGANAEVIKDKVQGNHVTFINNPNWKAGLSSSIASAINYIQNSKELPDGVLIMLADQPNVDSNYLNELIKIYQSNQNHIIASAYGKTDGVPALFPSKYFKKLLSLKGDKGAKIFLNENQESIIRFTSESTIVLRDIDTPEDYQKLIKNIL